MVFLDVNIILEVLLHNRLRDEAVARALSTIDQPMAVSMLTVHLVWYFGRKDGVSDATLTKVLRPYEILSLEADDYAWALANEQGRDFEDALQVAAALRAGCDTFMTLDSKLARRYCELPLKFIVP